MTEKLKKILDENKQYSFIKDMFVCLENPNAENKEFRDICGITSKALEEYLTAEAIINLVKSYIQKHHISCPESIYQMDKPQVDAIDLVCDLCEIVGFLEEDEEEWL